MLAEYALIVYIASGLGSQLRHSLQTLIHRLEGYKKNHHLSLVNSSLYGSSNSEFENNGSWQICMAYTALFCGGERSICYVPRIKTSGTSGRRTYAICVLRDRAQPRLSAIMINYRKMLIGVCHRDMSKLRTIDEVLNRNCVSSRHDTKCLDSLSWRERRMSVTHVVETWAMILLQYLTHGKLRSYTLGLLINAVVIYADKRQ